MSMKPRHAAALALRRRRGMICDVPGGGDRSDSSIDGIIRTAAAINAATVHSARPAPVTNEPPPRRTQMTNEVLEKIRRIISAASLTESEVQHLFNLSRKLIERLPEATAEQFALLKFYCDWTAHSKIDRSAEGALVVERLHSIVNAHMKRRDNSTMVADLTAALSLDKIHDQLNDLLHLFDGEIGFSIDDIQWRRIVVQLLEVITHSPLKIAGAKKSLMRVRERIKATPIKGRAIVEQVAIVKIPRSTFHPQTLRNDAVLCIELTLSDTTKIIAPLVG